MRNILFLISVLTSLLLSVGCANSSSGGTSDNTENEVIKIGWFGPLTGPTSTDGQISLNATQLAVDQINEAGGINGSKVELISADDQGNPQEGVKAVQKLINNDEVVAIISGAYTGPTLSTAPIVQKEKVPMIVAYAKHPDITKAGDFVTRLIYTSDVQAHAMADYAVNDLQLNNFAVLYTNNDFGVETEEAFKKRVEELGSNILISRSFNMGDTDFNSILSSVNEVDPDGLLVVAYYSEGAAIVRQAKELGIDAQIIAVDSIDSPKYIELAGDSAEGTIISTSFYADDEREIVKDFVEAYLENFDTELSITAAQSYDSALIIMNAIESVGTERESLAEAIRTTEDFEGITGNITINENNEVIKPIIFVEVKEGKYEFVMSEIY